jgi:1-acyl-sn-glycerol-3-phosphate acyltransferase
MKHLIRVLQWIKLAYEYFVLYGGLLLFGLISLAWSVPAGLLYLVLPRKIGLPLGQFAIMTAFRWFLFALRITGIVKLDLTALDDLRETRSLIIAPNHPSLLDVLLVVSRLPRVVCVMKAEIWDNLFLGGGARLAGYIRNDSPGNMIRLAAEATRTGSQLLVFPEGTRTRQDPVNPFKGGFALIAKTAGVTVQTVFIETNSPFLSKNWPLFKKPAFPLIYRARLGKQFQVDGNVKIFLAELENYYRQALSRDDSSQTAS